MVFCLAVQARLLLSLNHPGIVRAYGLRRQPLSIVMERCDKSLHQLLHEDREVTSWHPPHTQRCQHERGKDIGRGTHVLMSCMGPVRAWSKELMSGHVLKGLGCAILMLRRAGGCLLLAG